MDKALYVAMTGARATLQAQTAVSHNIANANTAGFKAALSNTEAFRVPGDGYGSRIDALHVDQGYNRSVGAQQITGNSLDISLQENRWLAIQSPNGEEAYTRDGNLALTPNGQLITMTGHAVYGENGEPIVLPPHQSMEIGHDGTVSIVPLGEPPQTLAMIGRLKIVDAPAERLQRGLDGLMRNADPQQPFAQATGSTMASGVLESSNVDAAGALVQMIELQRSFEMQVKLIKSGDENTQLSNTMMRLNG